MHRVCPSYGLTDPPPPASFARPAISSCQFRPSRQKLSIGHCVAADKEVNKRMHTATAILRNVTSFLRYYPQKGGASGGRSPPESKKL